MSYDAVRFVLSCEFNEVTMPIEEFKQPLIPLLKALRKRKIALSIFGESARAKRADSIQDVEVHDLVRRYSVGEIHLDELVAEVVQQIELSDRR
jgi:hypothetical protein